MNRWSIGCSGYHYTAWKEVFYPKTIAKKNWLEYYSTNFETLEINSTFYRFPALSVFHAWYERTPKHFSFSVKAPRAITQYRKLINCDAWLHNYYTTVTAGLKEKVKCFLFQMPPNFAYNEERLERIIKNLNPNFPNVVEFRNASWWNELVYKTLGENNISFCGMSHPDLPEDIIANTPLLYYRLHGTPEIYSSSYSKKFLQELFLKIQNKHHVKETFIYFNNDIGCNAVKNARQLQTIVLEKKAGITIELSRLKK